MTGMHHVLIAQMIQLFAANGYDPVVSLGATSCKHVCRRYVHRYGSGTA